MPGSFRINNNSPIIAPENNPMLAHLKKDGFEYRQVVHPRTPMTDAEIQRQNDFAMHSVAQAAANRRGPSPVISPEEANRMRIQQMARQPEAAPQPSINPADLQAVAQQLVTLLGLVKRMDADMTGIAERLDVLEGASVGDTT